LVFRVRYPGWVIVNSNSRSMPAHVCRMHSVEVPALLVSVALDVTDRSMVERSPPTDVTLPVALALALPTAVSAGMPELAKVVLAVVDADAAGPFSATGTESSAPPVGT
jgi:hypothetical protein